MATREIIQKGDPVLEKKSHPVTTFDRKLHALLHDMRDTLTAARGAGLAAPQIGILRRVVVLLDEEECIVELVNPEIVETSGEQDGLEGCLSLSGLYGFVNRPDIVTVRAQNRRGEPITITGKGIVARCLCHELEHLDGQLFDSHTDELYSEDQLDELLKKQEAEEAGE